MPSANASAGTGRRRRRRWLPRTGPRATWPPRARVAANGAVFVTVLLLIFGFLLLRYSPERFLRLVAVYRSLPVAVVAVVLVSGVIYFLLDTVRLLLTSYLAGRPDPARLRRPLLLGMLGLWLVLTVAVAVPMLWYPSAVLFGGSG